MTKEQAVSIFKEQYIDLYIKKVDYWTAQLTWTEFTDCLCKNGQITQRQFATWSTPFPYGRRLYPNRRQLEIAAYKEE